jgi:hypothetical protein
VRRVSPSNGLTRGTAIPASPQTRHDYDIGGPSGNTRTGGLTVS